MDCRERDMLAGAVHAISSYAILRRRREVIHDNSAKSKVGYS